MTFLFIKLVQSNKYTINIRNLKRYVGKMDILDLLFNLSATARRRHSISATGSAKHEVAPPHRKELVNWCPDKNRDGKLAGYSGGEFVTVCGKSFIS
jgi:hypothetical protein